MNERDEFAAAALTGIITNIGADADPTEAANLAFGFANAMMLRRHLGEPGAITQDQPEGASG